MRPSLEPARGHRDNRATDRMTLTREADIRGSTDAEAADPAAPVARVLAFADRHRRWVYAGIVLLYLAGYTGSWPVSSDSALYAALGRNLYEGRGYTYQGEPHTWVEPGTPLLVALSFTIGGPEAFWPVMAVMVGLSLACLALFHAIVRLNHGRPTAVLLTAALAVTETFYRYGYFLFTDVPFLAAVLVLLLGYELIVHRRGRASVAAGWALFAAGSFLLPALRPVWATILGGFVVGAVWQIVRGRRRAAHGLMLAVVLVAVVGFRAVDPRRAGVDQPTHIEAHVSAMATEHRAFVLRRMVVEHLPQLFERTVPQALLGVQTVPGLNSAFTAAVVAACLALVRVRPTWAMVVAATLAQLAFHLPKERYLVPVLPIVLIAVWRAVPWAAARVPARHRAVALGAAGAVVLLANVVAIGRYVVTRHREAALLAPYTFGDDDDESALPAVAAALRDQVGDGPLVVAQGARELHYFSRCRTVAPLTSRRVPPSPRELAAFGRQLAQEPALYVVLPGRWTEELVRQVGIEVGPPVPLGGGLSLHRAHVVPGSPTPHPSSVTAGVMRVPRESRAEATP